MHYSLQKKSLSTLSWCWKKFHGFFLATFFFFFLFFFYCCSGSSLCELKFAKNKHAKFLLVPRKAQGVFLLQHFIFFSSSFSWCWKKFNRFFFAKFLTHTCSLQKTNLWNFSWCQKKLHGFLLETIFLFLCLFLLLLLFSMWTWFCKKQPCQASFNVERSLMGFFFATFHSFPTNLLWVLSFARHWQKIGRFFFAKFLTHTLSLQYTIPCNFSWHWKKLHKVFPTTILLFFLLLHLFLLFWFFSMWIRLCKKNPPSFSWHREKFNGLFFKTIHSFQGNLLLVPREAWRDVLWNFFNPHTFITKTNLWSFFWCRKKLHDFFPTTIIPFFPLHLLFIFWLFPMRGLCFKKESYQASLGAEKNLMAFFCKILPFFLNLYHFIIFLPPYLQFSL